MLHSVYAATALTMVMAMTFPFMSGTEAENASVLLSGSSSSFPLISSLESWAESRDATVPIGVYVAHQTSSDAESDGEASSTDSGEPQNGDSSSSGGASGGSTSGGTSSGGTSSGGTTSGGTSGGGTTGGGTTTGGESTPAPKPTTPPSSSPAPSPSAPAPSAPPAPVCPAAISGSTPGAPSRTSPLGVAGTTSADLQSFAQTFNAIRVANCLPPVPFGNIRYDSCMEDRLFWMAEDPSTDPMSAWGHIGSVRSDGLASVGCDGNLAGGSGNTGSTVAQKWWDSSSHRASLYKPTYTSSTARVCILFSMTHGGVPNEPYSFTRAAARWVNC